MANVLKVVSLCEDIRRQRALTCPTGFWSPSDCMSYRPSPQEIELDQYIESLGRVARMELVALKLFGSRVTIRQIHWEADLRTASQRVSDPQILLGGWLDIDLRDGFKNLKRAGLVEVDPLEIL